MELDRLADEIARCRICRDTPVKMVLPHDPRPVVQLSQTARICIAGQAPGARVHASGRPFTDPSGDRLRAWMGIGEGYFYNSARPFHAYTESFDRISCVCWRGMFPAMVSLTIREA